MRITNKFTFLQSFDSYESVLTIRANLIVNINLVVILIQTYWEVPHLWMGVAFTIRAFHNLPLTILIQNVIGN